MDWNECLSKRIAKNINIDDDLLKALKRESENKLKSANSIILTETSASSKLSLIYDSLREILEAIAIKNGYKIYNHECYTYFLKEVLKESDKGDTFEEIRKLRNAINYYGKQISKEEANKTILKITDLRKNLLEILKIKVLFLCKANMFRSQMAEAWYKKFSSNLVDSAAIVSPQNKMHKLIVRAMESFGLDSTKQHSKLLSPDLIKNADIIVLMSRDLESIFKDYKSVIKKDAKVEVWQIPDIVASETDESFYPHFVKACEQIRNEVKQLVKKYG